jgi:hypothetical protein
VFVLWFTPVYSLLSTFFIIHLLRSTLWVVSELWLQHLAVHLRFRFIIDCIFKLFVSSLLNLLSILQFLYEFHFEHFHLHYFSFFLSNCFFLLCYLSCYIFSCSFYLTSFELFNLGSLYLLLSSLFFHPYVIFLFYSHLLLLTSLFILMTNEFSLLGFFLLMK